MSTTNPTGEGWIVAATGPGYVTVTPANLDLNYVIWGDETEPNVKIQHVFESRTDRTVRLEDGEVLQVFNPKESPSFALVFTADVI